MTAPDVDDRIRRALQAQAELVREADLRPAMAPTSTAATGHRRWQWSLPLLAAGRVLGGAHRYDKAVPGLLPETGFA